MDEPTNSGNVGQPKSFDIMAPPPSKGNGSVPVQFMGASGIDKPTGVADTVEPSTQASVVDAGEMQSERPVDSSESNTNTGVPEVASSTTTTQAIEPVVAAPPNDPDTDMASSPGDLAEAVEPANADLLTPIKQIKPKRRVSLLPIIIALVVALLLAGLTVFAFSKTRSKNPTASKSSSKNQSASSTKSSLSVADAEGAQKFVDEALKVDDQADINVAELSDATLSL